MGQITPQDVTCRASVLEYSRRGTLHISDNLKEDHMMKDHPYQYKIDQLQAMLTIELDPNPNVGGYGAHLQHWYGNSKGIQLDAGALKALIDYYTNKI